MDEPRQRCREIPVELLEEAGLCRQMADFSRVLKKLAEIADADACALWEVISFGSSERRYFALADSFPGGLTWHFLPEKSVTDEAVKSQRPQVVDDVEFEVASGRVAEGKLLREKGVHAFCSLPLSLGKQRDGTLNIYRFEQRPFTPAELARITPSVSAIPYLYRSVRNEMGFRLMRKVEDLLRGKGIRALQEVLEEVTQAFNAAESAIFLENPLERPGVYALRASVWPWAQDWKQIEYRKQDEGMTPWTIRHGKTLRIFDLSHFEEEARHWGYEGAVCRHKEKLQASARDYFKRETLPPLSFISVPIRSPEQTIGAIRCCVTRCGPHLFDDQHIEILTFVADQISERWTTQMRLDRGADEKRRLDSLTTGVDRLNGFAFHELRKPGGPSIARQMQSAMELLGEISGFPDALSVRLLDPARKELYVAEWRGAKWTDGGFKRQSERTGQRFPTKEDFGGAQALREERVVVEERAGHTGRHYSVIFPDATRLLHAPIVVGSEAIGVLDVRGFGEQPFPARLDFYAGLIARQLGVYHHMFQQFRKLQQTTARLQKNFEEQSQIYDDFHHQISGPVQRAHAFAQEVLEVRPAPAKLKAIRGNLRQAEQVARNIKYFVSLAKGEPIRVERQRLTFERLAARLKELADDQECLADPARGLLFEVDRDSFRLLDFHSVWSNMELLEHAVMNLLDNAAKYSERGTTVVVRGGFSHHEKRFALSVVNKGHKITVHEKNKLTERGYRGDRARLTVVAGRGIGLYIVEQFMQAMDGDLKIIPTDSRGLNEFRLMLSCT